MDNLNPRFIRSFVLDYQFEARQKLKIAVYDVDDFSQNASLEGHDFVGDVELFLHEVVTAPDQQLRRVLSKPGKRDGAGGTIVLTAEEKKSKNNMMLEMEFRAVDVISLLGDKRLPKNDWSLTSRCNSPQALPGAVLLATRKCGVPVGAK